MFGSNVLDIAIGIIFIYLIISLICTSINEWIASFLNQRGKNLFEGIKNLMNDPSFTGLAQMLYSHGLVDGISEEAADPKKPNRLPSYMPSDTFALALMNILRAGGADPVRFFEQRVAQLTKRFPNITIVPDDKKTAAAGDSQQAQSPVEKVTKAISDLRAARDAGGATPNPEQAAAIDQAWAAVQKELDSILSSLPKKGFYNFKGRIPVDNLLSTEFEQFLSEGLNTAATLEQSFTPGNALTNIQNAVNSLPSGHTKESLLTLIDKTKHDVALMNQATNKVEDFLQKFQKNLEDWYNTSMDRIGGWYKRWTQKVLLILAFCFVLSLNIDTLKLYHRLSTDKELRNSISTAAQDSVKQASKGDKGNIQFDKLRETVQKESDTLKMPFGWSVDWKGLYISWSLFWACLLKLIGLLISAFAISLGAPFWFDTLSKVVNLRGAGTPPNETKKSAPQPK